MPHKTSLADSIFPGSIKLGKAYIKSAYIFLAFFSIVSCVKEIEFEGRELPKKLVINSFFTGDSILKVHVSYSNSVQNPEHTWLEDANVRLFRESVLIDTLSHLVNGQYCSKYMPEPGIIYSINVSATDFPDVSAQNYCPSQPELIECIVNYNIGVDGEGSRYSEARITFKDDPLGENYYEITTNQYSSLFSFDPVLTAEGDLDYYPYSVVFSDKLISSDVYTMSFNFYDTNQRDDVIIFFRKTSYEYYLYKKKLQRHLFDQGFDFWQGVNPVITYTNVENGYGIFAGYSEIRDTIPYSELTQ